MIYAKANNYGLDAKILQLQNALQDELRWFDLVGIADSDIAIYGKIYKNVDENNNVIPEAYKTNTDYSQIFVDDKIIATIGFNIVGNRTVTERNHVVALDMICTANIERLYAGTRDDEKVLIELMRVIRNDNMIISITEVREGISAVFEGFYTEPIKFNGMHPWYCCSTRMTVQYFDDVCNDYFGK